MPQDGGEILDFTPENGFKIEKLAPMIVTAMTEMNMDAQLTLPGRVVLEIEQGCTAEEIIDGYKEYLSAQVRSRPASNRNEKLEPA